MSQSHANFNDSIYDSYDLIILLLCIGDTKITRSCLGLIFKLK